MDLFEGHPQLLKILVASKSKKKVIKISRFCSFSSKRQAPSSKRLCQGIDVADAVLRPLTCAVIARPAVNRRDSSGEHQFVTKQQTDHVTSRFQTLLKRYFLTFFF